MASEVFEDALDLRIGLLEATMPSGVQDPAYPFPSLTPTGKEEMRQFRVLILENPYLRATFVPALGGRLLRLFDKRTGKDILPLDDSLIPVAGGLRGASLREGMQVRYLAQEDRLNSLGSVDSAPEEGDEAGVWIAESAGGGPLSYHLYASLPPDRAELTLEVRFFNRSLQTQPYNGAVAVFMPGSDVIHVDAGIAIYDIPRNTGLAFFWETPLAIETSEGFYSISRFSDTGSLGPRQLDTIRLRLTPLSGLGGLSDASPEGGLFLDDERVRVQSTERRLGHKLLLVTDDGQTLEAAVDLHPERHLDIPLNGLRPRTVVLRDPAKIDVLRADVALTPPPMPIPPVQNPAATISTTSSEIDLERATFDVSQRALAHALLGTKALGRGEYAMASEQYERSLLFNAEDHLTWWLKAIAERMGGAEGEIAELLNAHYLAPLEPALRAEAFLAQGQNQGKEANPLVAPLAEIPENLVEVACLLLEAELLPEASQWIDEALRHRNLPILHLLQAYALKMGTRMDAEAARHVSLAGGMKEPPFPWREVEWKAIGALGIRHWILGPKT